MPIRRPAAADGTIPAVPAVYSFPMHSAASNPITSSLEVAISRINGEHDKTLVTNFRAELVTKSAATALWSVYDEARDPLIHGRPAALLNGTAATVQLVQAVRLFPPLPMLYPSKIIDFDATVAMRKTITGDFPVPQREEQGAEFSGDYFEADKPDDVAGQTARWQDFGKAWIPPTTGVAAVRAGIVKSIADVLEWTSRPPDQMARNDPSPPPLSGGEVTANEPRVNSDGRTDWQLFDAPPALLVQQLDKYYPALPFVTGTPVAAAA